MNADAPTPQARRDGRQRAARAPQSDESWFGALGVSGTDSGREDDWGDDAESRFGTAWQGADAAQADSRFISRQARRIVTSGTTAFERLYTAFVAARAALGIALLMTLVVAEVFGVRPPMLVSFVCLGYALQATTLWLRRRGRRDPGARPLTRLSTANWLNTIGVDVLTFSVLHLIPSSGLNYVALLVLPVLMAGVLTPRTMALATAAGVSLVLLFAAWLEIIAGGEATRSMTQAGLAGSGLFVITLLAGEMAGRLAREELTARGSLELARRQAQLNRLVIEEMQDGVLVVDRKCRVRAANPAARALLAASGSIEPAPFPLRGVEPWRPLLDAVECAFAEGAWPEAGREVTLQLAPQLMRTLRLRVRFTRRRDPQSSEEMCVLFMEDLRSVQARIRQEKLAAMGRVSAGIAHEIRNPLAAIAQANALLAEDATTPGQQQLTRLVSDNVERLKRIVDDVMAVAPGAPSSASVIDAAAIVSQTCGEWARTEGLPQGEDGALRMHVPSQPLGVVFDAEHLRRVLVNLLDNARRHGGEAPGAIELRLQARDERLATLSIASGGRPIPPDVERFLFEPFFSTRSRGTGLGLYISRELCERHGASIEYRQRPPTEPNCNEFVVVMRRESLHNPASAEPRTLFTA